MAEQYFSEFENRKLVKISGSEAESFLQNILTCNIETIASGGAGFGGLLSPQGKILFDFFVIRDGQAFLLDVDATLVDDLIKRLAFYRLRADVGLDICDDEIRVFAVWGGDTPVDVSGMSESAIVVPDPRLPNLGWRVYSSAAPAGTKNNTGADYHAHRIALGMPEGGRDYSFGNAFPHEALYDQIGGVDFNKGCYVGQEVISRMHHRGTARKRVIQVTGGKALPDPGTKITALGKPVGEMASVCGNIGLANLRLDRTNEAIEAAEPIMAGDVSLNARIQPWAKFDWLVV